MRYRNVKGGCSNSMRARGDALLAGRATRPPALAQRIPMGGIAIKAILSPFILSSLVPEGPPTLASFSVQGWTLPAIEKLGQRSTAICLSMFSNFQGLVMKRTVA